MHDLEAVMFIGRGQCMRGVALGWLLAEGRVFVHHNKLLGGILARNLINGVDAAKLQTTIPGPWACFVPLFPFRKAHANSTLISPDLSVAWQPVTVFFYLT